MRFVQFDNGRGQTKVGVLSEDRQKIAELKGYPTMLAFLESGTSPDKVTLGEYSVDAKSVKLQSPVTGPEKIICVGLNYRGHCEEQNLTPPVRPMFFSKFASALTGPNDPVIAHEISREIDWEVEMAVVIGKGGKKIPQEKAYDHVFGYCVAQDISARDWQKVLNNKQFLIGKSMDTFCPLGPALVHKSLVADPHKLTIQCSVNGVQKQKGNTDELVFRIDDLIHRVSQGITLKAGDVILTGTPGGVGMHRNPPEFLKAGDVIVSEIEGLGQLVNPVAKDE